MATTTSTTMDAARLSELRRILNDRRCQIQSDVHDKLRDVRDQGTCGGHLHEVLDGVEVSDADVQDDIDFAIIQMKSETLGRIDEALVRLRDGDYGYCFDCGAEISEKRLRAMPFAVRCKPCEESREAEREYHARHIARHDYRGGMPRALQTT